MYSFMSYEDLKTFLKTELMTEKEVQKVLKLKEEDLKIKNHLKELEPIEVSEHVSLYLKSEVMHQKEKDTF